MTWHAGGASLPEGPSPDSYIHNMLCVVAEALGWAVPWLPSNYKDGDAHALRMKFMLRDDRRCSTMMCSTTAPVKGVRESRKTGGRKPTHHPAMPSSSTGKDIQNPGANSQDCQLSHGGDMLPK